MTSKKKQPSSVRKGENVVDRLSTDLINRIVRGDYGDRGVIPSIAELCDEWGEKNKAAGAEAVAVAKARGYLVQTRNKRYRVSYPVIELEGLTANFRKYLIERHYEPMEEDVITPCVEMFTNELAALFRDALIVGSGVVHRERLQGIKIDRTLMPLRIGHIFYPEDVVAPYMASLLDPQAGTHFDVLAALADDGTVVDREKFIVRNYTRATPEEKKLLHIIGYTHPMLEVLRVCYAGEKVITLHRTIWDGAHVSYTFEREVTHFKK